MCTFSIKTTPFSEIWYDLHTSHPEPLQSSEKRTFRYGDSNRKNFLFLTNYSFAFTKCQHVVICVNNTNTSPWRFGMMLISCRSLISLLKNMSITSKPFMQNVSIDLESDSLKLRKVLKLLYSYYCIVFSLMARIKKPSASYNALLQVTDQLARCWRFFMMKSWLLYQHQ